MVNGRRTSWVGCAVAAALAWAPAAATAEPRAAAPARYEIPDCAGTDQKAAVEAFTQGRRLYLKAVKRTPPNARLLRRALAQFEAQCAAGDSMALERIASALVALGRYVDAARTFDHFLALHPKSSLAADDLARVQANETLYYQQVGSLRVQADPEGSEVRLDGGAWQNPSGQVFRRKPGDTVVEVRAPGHESEQRKVNVAPGELVTLEFALRVPAAPPGAAGPASGEEPIQAPASRTSDRPSPVAPAAVAADNPPTTPDGGGLSAHAVWLLSAGAATGIGVAGLIWSGDRSRRFEDAGCPADPDRSPCGAIETEFEIARGIQIGGFVTGATLATIGGFVWLKHIADAPGRAAGCVPALGRNVAMTCEVRF